MSWQVRKPFTLVTYGTSLTTGRLSAQWVERLQQALYGVPEAIGPVIVYNMGRGSQTSAWGAANAYLAANMRPTHILTEGFAINDSALVGGVPQVSQTDHLLNMASMRATWKAANPSVDITWQTMSSVSSDVATGRPNLANYYADEMTYAAAQGDTAIDNYLGPGGAYPGPSGGWPKPLSPALTYDGDGLHPLWSGADDTYLFPNVRWWARVKMAAYWGLPAPV
ncbi:MAG: hypothetical protein IOC86_04525 [Aestuariivirga sp.]|nr:hypothetical protein [Aestuariivirga sp.]